MNSFVGNSAILRRSCYKEVTFYLTIKVFWSQQHIVQRKSFVLYACSSNSQEIFTQKTFTRNTETLYSSQYRNIIIIANAVKQLIIRTVCFSSHSKFLLWTQSYSKVCTERYTSPHSIYVLSIYTAIKSSWQSFGSLCQLTQLKLTTCVCGGDEDGRMLL